MILHNKKIGCFSDIHLGIYHDDKNWHDIILNFAKWVSDLYKKYNIEDIIIPGDIFHNRNEIGVETLHTAKRFFDYLKDFNVYISAGNHDSFLKHKSDINSISIFHGWKNIHVIDKECLFLKYKDKKICLVPWGIDYDQIPKSDIIFGHFEINSFYMNSFKICEKGLESNDLFKKSKFIISGHFHKKDFREYQNGKILYLGSPYQQNFGDTLDERGAYILDLEEESFEFYENDSSPKHIKLSLKQLTNGEDDLENLKNNIVKLIVDINTDQEIILETQNKILNQIPLTFKTEYQLLDNVLDIDENLNFTDHNFVSDIEDYLSNVDLEHKKEVVEYLKELYNSLV
jgi:DNA repair exonuclease SbcCD nuclease subunit